MIKSLCTLSLYPNKVWKYHCLHWQQKRGGAYIIASKGNLHFKICFQRINKKKLKQTKEDEIKKQSYLNCTTGTKYAFCFLIYFSPDILAKNPLKKCVSFVFIS